MIKITAPKNHSIANEVELNIPSSKSISNRALILQAIDHKAIKISNLSTANDTVVLQKALHQVKTSKTNQTITINIGLAGTAFRFLTAFLATKKGTFILNGAKRIQERPIKPLVDALRQLGADIQYLDKENFAPLLIKGKKLQAKAIDISAEISSQFISALLLISPKIENGLVLNLKGEIYSKPYIEMTLALLNHFGITSSFKGNKIEIKEQKLQANHLAIEADWSSASYIYSVLALAKKGKVFLPNYAKNSLQGDSKVADLFLPFGVKTNYTTTGILLEKTSPTIAFFEYNFAQQPDLAQTFVALCVGLGIEAKLSGLESLQIKETDRIQALHTEIERLGWSLTATANNSYDLKANESKKTIAKNIQFKTYKDHRMAMCLAPLALKFDAFYIEDEAVVIKSNPLFWEQMKTLGFRINKIKSDGKY